MNKDILNQCLWSAVIAEDENLCQELINLGADVNCTHDGWSLLMIAAKNFYYEIAKILIKNGANIKFIDESKASALYVLVVSHSKEIKYVDFKRFFRLLEGIEND